MGPVGDANPAVPRSQWFPTPNDVETFQATLKALCSRGSSSSGNTSTTISDPITAEHRSHDNTFVSARINTSRPKRKRLVIYQRDRTRKILDVHELKEKIKSILGQAEWSTEVISHQEDQVSPCQLVQEFASVDVLVTSHGFQTLLLLFMPRGQSFFYYACINIMHWFTWFSLNFPGE